jgi:ABC-type phosphate/phosphonate transport system substrate-binding protein
LKPDTLRFTSCQAPIAEEFCAGVARYVGEHLAIAVEFIDGIPWQQRLREFDAGRIHVCWMCGLPYVWRADQPEPSLELLAAPVMAGSRYADQPVYFSDVVLAGDVDATALDSTVLDLLRRRDPSLERRVRVVESFGPSPSPPWVVARTVPRELRAALRRAFLAMSSDPRGRRVDL